MRVILGVALLMLPAAPVAADEPPTATLQSTAVKGFKAQVKTTTAGTVHRNRVRVLGGAPREVLVQYSRDGATWVTKTVTQTNMAGRLVVTMKVLPKRNRWRIYVPATAAHSTATSPVKTFAVQLRESTPTAAPIPTVTSGQIAASKSFARDYILEEYGWGDKQWFALEQLWARESGWNHLAVNPSSGATGIPQSLPGDKMASHGADWRTNPQTQIKWGAWYIDVRYGTPRKAWQHFLAENWY